MAALSRPVAGTTIVASSALLEALIEVTDSGADLTMTDNHLIASVRAGDLDGVGTLLGSGVDIEARDEHGWTALDWAAGAGHAKLVRLLIDRGADVFACGVEGRTPYQIAIAASRIDAARLLAEAEAARGGEAFERSSGRAAQRPYCRAYPLGDLRLFPHWKERKEAEAGAASGESLSDDSVVFLHHDFSVTNTASPREGMIFDGDSADWRRYCADQLSFHPPSDFDWLPGATSRNHS